MIRDTGSFYSKSHYFDSKGHVHDVEVGSVAKMNPEPMGFLSEDGRILQLYLANNPWRATNQLAHSKIYQYCVVCNAKRFSDETFYGPKEDFQGLMDSKVRPGSGECLFQCKDLKCQGERWFDLADNLPNEAFQTIFTFSNTHQLPTIVAQERLKMVNQKV